MTPADRRINELIDKWLASVDLHLQYVELSDAAYARAQPWPKHDRPSRWVLEVARQKILELKQHCETRQAMSDSRFAESLELMMFLANLVGLQSIQRFIPLADPAKEGTASTTVQTIEATVIKPVATKPRQSTEEATREMPRLKPQPATKPVSPPAQKAPPATPAPARSAAKAPATAARPAPDRNPSAGARERPPETDTKAIPTDVKGKIIADAIRLLKWGKPWHELAELIGRIAERPPVPEIRKVLRAHKTDIEAQAGRPS